MVDELKPSTMWVRVGERIHDTLADRIDARKTAHVANILETFESDLQPLVAPLIQKLIDHPDTPPEVKQFLGPLVAPEHFSESIVISFAIGAMMSPILGSAIQPLVQTIANNAWSESVSGAVKGGTIPLQVDQLAVGAFKRVWDVGYAQQRAAESGISASDVQLMVDAFGSSSGIAEAFLLWRQGKIDVGGFEAWLLWAGINPQFFGAIESLFTLPLSIGEAVSANVKGWIDDTTTAGYLKANGIDPNLQQTLKHASGRPLTWSEVFTAIHRGYTGPITPEQALQQSDINDLYAPLLPFLQYKYPPLFQLSRLIENGSVTPARAATILKYEGYDPQEIDAIANGTKTTTTTSVHQITATQTIAMYRDRYLTAAAATARLEKIGYSAADVTTYLGYADDVRHVKLMDALISQIGSLYTSYRLTEANATVALDGGQVPTDLQADLFKIWNLERNAKIHHPTIANVVGAYRRTYITPAECKTRLLALGVQQSDLGVIVADGWPPTKGTEAIAAANAVVNA